MVAVGSNKGGEKGYKGGTLLPPSAGAARVNFAMRGCVLGGNGWRPLELPERGLMSLISWEVLIAYKTLCDIF
jgi:hypothetical protein